MVAFGPFIPSASDGPITSKTSPYRLPTFRSDRDAVPLIRQAETFASRPAASV